MTPESLRQLADEILERRDGMKAIAVEKELRQAADEIERLQVSEDQLHSYRIMDAGQGSRTAFIEQAKQAIKDAQKQRDEALAKLAEITKKRSQNSEA